MDNVQMVLAAVGLLGAGGAWVRRVEVELAERKKDDAAATVLVALHEKRLDRFENKLDEVLKLAGNHKG